MWFNTWFRRHSSQAKARQASSPWKTRSRRVRPRLEQLEDRSLPSNFFAATTADLIAEINLANKDGRTNTITLTAPTTSPYVLTAVDNTTNGANGLPVIANKDILTIVGNGDTIDASGYGRLFDVANGGSLTLENLMLQHGWAFGSGAASEGGAIYNQGTLVLSAVTVQGNVAQGSDGVSKKNGTGTPGNAAAGGGIWSNGSLTLENGSLVQNNQAIAGNGGDGPGGVGGDASGGGLYMAGGTSKLVGVTVNNNIAQGGQGSTFPTNPPCPCTGRNPDGSGYGGGLYVSSGTLTTSSDTLDGNQAIYLISDGETRAFGGGIFVANGTVNLSSDVVDSNQARGTGGGNSNDGGGGIFIGGGTVSLCNETVEYNITDGSGGGILIYGSTVYIDSFTVANSINNANGNIEGSYILQTC